MRYLSGILFICMLAATGLHAHPMPSSVMSFDIKSDGVTAELMWPLKEFQLAFPNEDIDVHSNTLIDRKSAWLDEYLHAHMSITDSTGHLWTIAITGKQVTQNEQSYTGPFHALVFKLWLLPPAGSSPRHFIMHYDAIMHQVVTHKMFIIIRQDWDGGLAAKDSTNADLGVLMMNISDNKVPPVIVNLDEGTKWKGFKNMVSLGIAHIADGTDHLLFLLVLMLPAPLLAFGGKWGKSGGTRYSIIRLLKIATAFTIGHSVTLLAGTVGWVRLPTQPVEILISVSILIGAIHALRPIFPGKEVFIAAGFGLIHGLAFAATLANLNLDAGRMALSILGFNIGIELMQLFVLLLFVPWLIILSQYSFYKFIMVTGALFAIIASLAWIAERIVQKPNKITLLVQTIAKQGQWIVLVLAVAALISYFLSGKRLRTNK